MRARVTSALYRRMGVADTVVDCLADYAARAVQVATDRDLSHSIRERIRNTRDLIFRQTADVREIEAFLAVAVRAARAGDAITIWGAPE
jgi:predicted O-linked N-acetylglucosamine transferase (SPINDLY family)